jgi:uncharacterized delta-60 repeat protein
MKRKTITSTLTALLITALLIPGNLSSRSSAHAQDVEAQAVGGDLDAGFGNGGKATISLPGKSIFNTAAAMQADGKIVVVGYTQDSDGFVVARLNTDGSLDTSFGDNGRVITVIFGRQDSANAIALQADGKIVVAGGAWKGGTFTSQDFALARYNADGSLDTNFGSGGKVTTDFFGTGDQAWTVAVQTDGKIIVGGIATKPGNNSGDFALAQYNTNGSLDTSFGADGKVVTDFGQGDSLSGIAIQPDGKIVGAGFTGTSSPNSFDFALARYNADGTLDSSFGTGGKTTTDFFGFNDDALAVKLARNGTIVVGGECLTGGGSNFDNFALARYKSNGTLDTGFGAGGKVTTDFDGHIDAANTLAIQSDDKIIAGGYAAIGSAANRDFALARYNLDGSLDTSFGAGGKVTTDFSGRSDEASTLILQSDDQIVLAGTSYLPAPSAFALARYTAGAIVAPGFSLGFEQSPVTGERGTTVKVHVLINRTGGFSGNVTVTPPDAAGLKIKVKPPFDIPTTEDSVTFKLKIKGGATPGSHQLTFTARDDAGHTASADLTLMIQ